MANAAMAVPTLLTDPGFLYWAPLASTPPVSDNTMVTASKFTNTWAAPWVPLGPTDSGGDFTYTSTVQAVSVAEFLDPIGYRTTERSGNFAFALANPTAANMVKVFNGAATVVTGTGTTQSTKLSPPAIGAEVRAMIGWEALDSTFRIVAYQCINSGSIKLSFNKAPARTTVPCTFNFEIPASTGNPWDMWTTR
jgi:hypothetical protein